jgi:hypothetical protein
MIIYPVQWTADGKVSMYASGEVTTTYKGRTVFVGTCYMNKSIVELIKQVVYNVNIRRMILDVMYSKRMVNDYAHSRRFGLE